MLCDVDIFQVDICLFLKVKLSSYANITTVVEKTKDNIKTPLSVFSRQRFAYLHIRIMFIQDEGVIQNFASQSRQYFMKDVVILTIIFFSLIRQA